MHGALFFGKTQGILNYMNAAQRNWISEMRVMNVDFF
jgi:hypothetical protein